MACCPGISAFYRPGGYLSISCPERRGFKDISISDISGPDPASPSDPRIFPLPVSRGSGKNGPGRPSVSGRARFRQLCKDQLIRLQHSPAHLSLRIAKQGHRLLLTVEGNGFLHHMVRNMAGTLLEVGRGTIKPERFSGPFFKAGQETGRIHGPCAWPGSAESKIQEPISGVF